jgi:hypothetical protein
MALWNAYRRPIMAAIAALGVAMSTMGMTPDRDYPPGELINRPTGPFACLAGESVCEPSR